MPLLTHPPARPSTARASALNRAVPSAHRISSKHPWHLKTDPHFGNPDYLPTCALAAHQTSPQGRMLLWALEAGADLLPPSEAMELRTAVLEQPTSNECINKLASKCEKDSNNLKLIYMSHICANCDENVAPKSANDNHHISPMRARGNESLDSRAPQFVLLNVGESLTRTYNRIQRHREKCLQQAITAKRKARQFMGGESMRNQQVDSQDTCNENTISQVASDANDYDDGYEGENLQEGAINEDEMMRDVSIESVPSPPTTLRRFRESIRAAEMALVKINKYVEQGPGYLLPLYRHHSSQINSVPSSNKVNSSATQTRSSLLRSAIASATVNGPVFGTSFLLGCYSPSQSQFLSSRSTTINFKELDGVYQMPSFGSLFEASTHVLNFRKTRKVFKQLQKLETGAEQDEGDDEADNLEEEEEGGGGEVDGPMVEVHFLPDTGTLSVKVRLSESQLLDIRSKISVPKVINANGKEEEVELAISTSPFLFQSEFVAIAADLWMGARGPWKGKMLHVARRQLRPDGTSALVEPPYLEPLGRLLDERAGLPQAAPATPPLPQCSTAIDSIMVGQWCFVKLEGRTGGRPDDPYRCTGCGNTRTSANIAYAAPSTASGLKRGKYYCPFCRRSMTHVNVALSLDPSAATRTPQWNGEPAVPLPSYKEAPLVAPLKGPMPRYINTKLHTMMGMTLI